MKIKFIGTGSAFCTKNFQTNTIIEQNGKHLLIDAGGDVRWALKRAGLSYRDIDSVYISHLHQDHLGGLEYLAFTSYFDPSMKDKQIQLIANNNLVREMWSFSLKGGLKSIQNKQTTLIDFFDITSIKPNGKFAWENIEFQIVQSVHVMDGYAIVPSFGFMIKPNINGQIYYTGDTQFNPNQIMDFYKSSTLIIQDCETTQFKSGVHANYSELINLPVNIKEKMCLIHYNDNIIESDEQNVIYKEWRDKAYTDGFFNIDGDNFGFIPRGCELEVICNEDTTFLKWNVA